MNAPLYRLTGRLRVLVWLGIVLLVILPALPWLDPDVGRRWPQSAEWPAGDRLIAWAISAAPMLVIAVGLGQLLAFCRRVREGRLFTEAAVGPLRRFGWTIIAASLFFPVSRIALWSFAGVAPGAAALWGRFVFGQLLLTTGVGLVIGLALLVFAAILREASGIAEENASFI